MSAPTPVALRPHHGYHSWTTTWYDDQGHRRTKRFGKEDEVSRLEAAARYQNWLANEYQAKAHVRNPSDPATTTVDQLADGYEAYAKKVFVKDGKPTGHFPNVHYAMRSLREHYGPSPINDIDFLKVRRLVNAMCIGIGGDTLSVKTVNGRLYCIKAAFLWGREQGWVSAVALSEVNSVQPLVPGRCEAKASREVEPVADTIIERTKPHLPQVVQDMVDVQLLTGMRPGEVCAMRPCDIDVSDDVWVYAPRTHKTEHKKKARQIAIGPKAKAILAPYLSGRKTTAHLFSPAEAQQQRRDAATKRRIYEQTTPLSCGNRVGTHRVASPKVKPGEHYINQSYRKAIRHACRAVEKAMRKDDPKATFPAWYPNQLRHSAGTRAREVGGYEAAVDLLGHAAPSTTAIYAERSLARAKEWARKVG